MKVITIFNEKGGVGKTTLTGIIGAGLAMRGYKVLLIDACAQGDLSVNMGLSRQAGFFKFVMWADKNDEDYTDVQRLIRRVPQDNCEGQLYVVQGNNLSSGIPNAIRFETMIANLALRFRLLEKVFDYVLVDTQPSPTMLHDAIGLISDWFIVPTDPEPLSAYGGLPAAIASIENIRKQSLARGRDKARLLGIIPNKYRVGTSLHRHIYKKLCELYGDMVFKPLPLRTTIPEGQFKQTTLMHDEPELDTNDYLWSIIDRVEKTTMENV